MKSLVKYIGVITVLLLFFFHSGKSYAQSYQPMLDSLSWITQHFGFIPTYYVWTVPQGDTIISGNNYKIYPNNNFLREDTLLRKVYRRNISNSSDDLWYDFNAVVGDTIPLHALQMSPFAVVSSRDSVLTYAGWRERWTATCWDGGGNPYSMTIVESIGSLSEPLAMFLAPNVDPGWAATCFYHHGQLVYSNGGQTCPNYLDTFAVLINPATCGQCNGSITVMHPFSWDPYQISYTNPYTPSGYEFLTDLCPQTTGTVVVTQQSTGFNFAQVYSIPNLFGQLVQTSTITNASCSSCCDGTASVTITSGSSPYVYSWTPNVSNSNTASGLCPGSYIVCVTDSNGCSACDTIAISFPTDVPDLASPDIVQRMKIWDATGRLLYEAEQDDNRWPISQLGSGIYLYELEYVTGERRTGKWCLIR